MFERIRKWLALRSYRADLGHLLLKRYGRARSYTPPQVLTTIKLHRFSERYAAYACAMFCSKRSYEDFAAAVPQADAAMAPRTGPNIPVWASAIALDWPVHGELIAELSHSYGHSDHSNFAADHHFGSFDSHHDTGTSSHHDGGHYGGYDGGGHHDGGHDGGGDGGAH